MSWIQKLYETYERVSAAHDIIGEKPWPLAHLVKRAHVEIVIDEQGNFRRCKRLERSESQTVIPATESSAARTSGVAPHVLCEELSYIAIDLPAQAHLQQVKAYFDSLAEFCGWAKDHVPAKASNKLTEIHGDFVNWLGLLPPCFKFSADRVPEADEDTALPKVPDLAKQLEVVGAHCTVPDSLKDPGALLVKEVLTLTRKHALFFNQLDRWCASPFRHSKAIAVRDYLRKGSIWNDLSGEKLLPVLVEDSQGRKTKIADQKVFVRWRVEEPGVEATGTWQDESMIAAWFEFDRTQNPDRELCMVTGEDARIGKKHPRFIRSSVDGAKLISSNDEEGYTYRGRFTDGKKDYGRQACTVGFDVSQKAHSALRWLITRQGYRNGDQVIVSWATSAKPIPRWFDSTLELVGIGTAESNGPSAGSDTAQAFGIRLRNAISGYGANLNPTDDIVVLAMDSATGNQGRMAITFYRELKSSEFLARIENWHEQCAWPQDFGQDKRFVGAPAPRDIADAAYGRWDERQRRMIIDEKLMKVTVERLLPCVIDGQEIPRDLVASVCHHATNRIGFKRSESGYESQWEKCLGIACALFKGHHRKRSYQMTLEQDRRTRDYLYGRLLAIADSIESYALSRTDDGKKRDTTAARFMQRFAERPFSTWRNIELALVPSVTRLKAGSDKSAAFLAKRRRLLDEVVTMMDKIDERTSDEPLSGEFLLGFHSQRMQFRSDAKNAISDDESNDEATAAATDNYVSGDQQ